MKKKLVLSITLVLVMALTLVLCACGPNSDPAKAKAALDENGYTAIEDKTIVPIALKLAGVDGISTVISGTKKVDDKTEHVTIIYFVSNEAASDAWEEVQEYASKEDKEEDSDWSIALSGKMIYYGTDQAVKDAK